MEIDTILYIVITLAILIISGLSGRKKKKAQMDAARIKAGRSQGLSEGEDIEEEPDQDQGSIFGTFQPSSNPFEKLEQILTGQVPQENQIPPPYESMEEETLEKTVDEEEQILEDIRNRNQESPRKLAEDESDTASVEATEKKSKELPELFKDIDEIKKAVIYSEILNRKY